MRDGSAIVTHTPQYLVHQQIEVVLSHGGQNTGTQKCPDPNPRNLTWQRDFADVAKVKDLKMETLSCIIWVSPV